MKRARKTSLTLLLLISLFSCSNENVVEKETLAKVYVDLLLVEDLYFGTDSLEMKMDEIFETYGISEENYDSSFSKLKHNTEEWDEFFELANTYLDTLKANQKKNEKNLEEQQQL